MLDAKLDISLIIPALNEEESIPELTAWISRTLEGKGLSFDIWFVDDGSTDKTWDVIKQLKAQYPFVKGIRFRRNYGKSAALNMAFEACQGRVVITMDADLQDSPDEIIPLYNMIIQENYDLVSGWKKVRYDNALTKNIPSKVYNTITGWMSGVKLHDMNCGLKAYKKEVIKSIEVFGEMPSGLAFEILEKK